MDQRLGTGALVAAIAALAALAAPQLAAADSARSAAAKREIARSYSGFIRALDAGHGRSACARLTASGRAELMGTAGLWRPWRGTCPEAVAKLSGVVHEPRVLRDVRIFGTIASARLDTGGYRFFVRTGRTWKVTATAPTNPLLPPGPRRPTAEPARFFGVSWDEARGWADDAATWAQDATRWRWFAPALAAALTALVLGLAVSAHRHRRRSAALQRSLEELTARAHRLAESVSSPGPAGTEWSVRDDLATLTRVNKELAARLDAVQSRSEDVTKRLLDELARTDSEHDEAGRLKQRLARSETARAEAHAEIEALQEHVRRLRERTRLPDESTLDRGT